MSRYRAFLIHLAISMVLVACVFSVVFLVWYPKPAFEVVGAFNIIRLLVMVDVIIGPLLTLVVYKHGKPGLKFDMAFIALVQLTALIYGAYRLYDERPQYMVFVIDRVEFVSEKRIDSSELRFDELKNRPLNKLVRVFARRPDDPEEFQKYMDSLMVEGKPDLEARPEYWEPWSAGAEEIREHVRLIEDLDPVDEKERENISRAVAEYGASHSKLGILPIGSVDDDVALLVDGDTLEVLGALRVDPWARAQSPPE